MRMKYLISYLEMNIIRSFRSNYLIKQKLNEICKGKKKFGSKMKMRKFNISNGFGIKERKKNNNSNLNRTDNQ